MAVLTNVGIWVDGLKMSGVSNSVNLGLEAETPEDTTFENDGWKSRAEGGLKSSAFSMNGFLDLGSGLDEAQFDDLGDDGLATIAPAGRTYGDLAYIVPFVESQFTPSGAIGELLAFAFASEGDGEPYRAQVFDVREDVAAPATTTRRQLGEVPSGETLHLWVHVLRNAGTLEIDLSSGAAMGGAVTQRTTRSSITGTGIYPLTVDGPITDEWWELAYTTTGASPDFDVAAATFFAAQNIVQVPITPPITPPVMGTVTVKGGLSADATPQASEITIDGVNHVISFPAFTNMRVLIWRLESQGDLTSIVLGSDPTRQNQIGGFTKFGSTLDVGGDTGNVWVSNQSLTFPAPDTFETA